MPKKATGTSIRWTKEGVATTRLTYGSERPIIRMPQFIKGTEDALAQERAALLALYASQMHAARVDSIAGLAALQLIAEARTAAILEAEIVEAKALIGGKWFPGMSKAPTFRQIAARWQSGELERDEKYKGKITSREEGTTTAAGRHLDNWILPIIGDIPVDRLELRHLNAVMENLNRAKPKLRSSTQRQYLTPMKTILDYCVSPLQLIPHSPMCDGWMPEDGPKRTRQSLTVKEDLRLMQCTEIPLWARILWGYFHRNGSRQNEALRIAISQFDLLATTYDVPSAWLFAHQTKTRRYRRWRLDEGTRRALIAWLAIARQGALPNDYMFVNAEGRRIVAATRGLPKLYRAHVRLAGITRPELFHSDEFSLQLRQHDGRAIFCTVKFACGWSESQIMEVTGHATSSELGGYRRADQLNRLEDADFTPLDQAIPELAAWWAAREPAAVPEPTPAQKQEAMSSKMLEALTAVANRLDRLELSLGRPAALEGAAATIPAPQPSPARLDALAAPLSPCRADQAESASQNALAEAASLRIAIEAANPAGSLSSQHSIVKQCEPTQPRETPLEATAGSEAGSSWQLLATRDGESMAEQIARLEALQARLVALLELASQREPIAAE